MSTPVYGVNYTFVMQSVLNLSEENPAFKV